MISGVNNKQERKRIHADINGILENNEGILGLADKSWIYKASSRKKQAMPLHNKVSLAIISIIGAMTVGWLTYSFTNEYKENTRIGKELLEQHNQQAITQFYNSLTPEREGFTFISPSVYRQLENIAKSEE